MKALEHVRHVVHRGTVEMTSCGQGKSKVTKILSALDTDSPIVGRYKLKVLVIECSAIVK